MSPATFSLHCCSLFPLEPARACQEKKKQKPPGMEMHATVESSRYVLWTCRPTVLRGLIKAVRRCRHRGKKQFLQWPAKEASFILL